MLCLLRGRIPIPASDGHLLQGRNDLPFEIVERPRFRASEGDLRSCTFVEPAAQFDIIQASDLNLGITVTVLDCTPEV
ncbi:hypothetical protein, partial [Bradyrhizobium rifense]|uniref:hypothetical protein n=1 Tax=Bradyrhizobium rifense TaxID=515499 RepID=UPI001AED4B60